MNALPVAQNPAVTDPMFTLTRGQRDCLLSIDHYRHQRRGGGFWMFGDKRFATATVTALERHGLVNISTRVGPIGLTTAGKLALDRLKELGT